GARRIDRLEKVANQALKAGAQQAHTHALDVSKTASVQEFVSWAENKLTHGSSAASRNPKLDVLINNAGGAHGLDAVAEGKDEDWETMFQTNVLGVLRMTRAVLPLMLNNPGSSIINIGSLAGHVAYEGGAAYCAAKAGELQITRAL